ncbi:hypothetical protein DIS24_g7849 [Lasiodiplodia hormozganensis]|uniref:Uncharacterized protein n=1 Tax=Lasiodiplodia hormozganensis TaxID=869390 RepID=A0AA39Y8I1_9PEZI|nr:hypothetical protein DIS24_g7849 [Lasiodiplodia hormozganensis]
MRFTAAASIALTGLFTLAAAADDQKACSKPNLMIKIHTGSCANADSLTTHVVGTGSNSSEILKDNPVPAESTSFFEVPVPFEGRIYVTENNATSADAVQGVAFKVFDSSYTWAQASIEEDSKTVVAPVKVNFATFAKWQGIEMGGAAIFNSRVGDPLVVSYCGSN